MTMNQTIRKVAINTGGGDAPGLNAVIRAVVHAAVGRGWECVGIRDGYNGILTPEEYPRRRGHTFNSEHCARHNPSRRHYTWNYK
jgi:6-phosphofructokinase